MVPFRILFTAKDNFLGAEIIFLSHLGKRYHPYNSSATLQQVYFFYNRNFKTPHLKQDEKYFSAGEK